MKVHQLPVLADNFIYLLHDEGSGECVAVDPAVSEPVMAFLEGCGLSLSAVWSTHHHGDHTGANLELMRRTGCAIVGPRADHERIPGIQQEAGEGDSLFVGKEEARVFDTPGHTRGHISFYFPKIRALFCGDVLFSLGCGKVFDGTFRQQWESLAKLRALPGDTRIYCAHEYTLENARFALKIEPGNRRLRERIEECERLRAEGKFTVPSLLEEELETNPFLRPESGEIREKLGIHTEDAAEIFTALRRAKDRFDATGVF